MLDVIDISLFVEDYAHREFLKALINRIAGEHGITIELDWQNARRGHGAVINELKQYLRDLKRGRHYPPSFVVVATDANCKGMKERLREVKNITDKMPEVPVVCAVPDPHIERWFLLDSQAFKDVFGRGCVSPDHKCERQRYKKMLIESIRNANIIPSIGGIEFAEDIVAKMNIDRVSRSDQSFNHFLQELLKELKRC